MRTTLFSSESEMSPRKFRKVIIIVAVVSLFFLSWLDSMLGFVLHGDVGTAIRDCITRVLFLVVSCGILAIISKHMYGTVGSSVIKLMLVPAIALVVLTWLYATTDSTLLYDLHLTRPDPVDGEPLRGSQQDVFSNWLQ